MEMVDIVELFVSIQGESSYAGMGCFFVRLAGCNLRCGYCDTPESLEAGQQLISISDIVSHVEASPVPLVEITGGEPLLQPLFPKLASALLRSTNKRVLVETNGSLDLGLIPEGAIAIVDVKTPESGAGDSFDIANLGRLRPHDELKFVLSSRNDYEWSREFVSSHGLADRAGLIHFSPVLGLLDPSALGQWIVDDGLPVRLQVQLHKAIGLQ